MAFNDWAPFPQMAAPPPPQGDLFLHLSWPHKWSDNNIARELAPLTPSFSRVYLIISPHEGHGWLCYRTRCEWMPRFGEQLVRAGFRGTLVIVGLEIAFSDPHPRGFMQLKLRRDVEPYVVDLLFGEWHEDLPANHSVRQRELPLQPSL
jgi:hypothetical protein